MPSLLLEFSRHVQVHGLALNNTAGQLSPNGNAAERNPAAVTSGGPRGGQTVGSNPGDMNYGQVNSAAGYQANEYGNAAMYPGNAASVPGTAASYPSNAASDGSIATQALHPPHPWATMPFWGLPGGQQWYPPPFPMPPFPPYWPQTSQFSREGSQEQAAPDPPPTSSSPELRPHHGKQMRI